MSLNLPATIAAYYAAEKEADFEGLAACFTEHAFVRDEGRTHEGRAAIANWMTEAKGKYAHKTEPLSVVDREGKVVVTARVTGRFPGSPIELEQQFDLDGGKIASLEIG
jgi:hypothetical protein